MHLSEHIDRIASTEHLDRADVIEQLTTALLNAAATSWGRGRKLDAMYDDGSDAVSIYQVVEVVEHVNPERALLEMDLATAKSMESEVGDELMLQVFYRDEDAGAASDHAGLYPMLPRMAELAPGLPLPAKPSWMKDVWPTRRLLWRWGTRVVLPAYARALDSLEAWLRSVAPELLVAVGAPSSELDALRALGPATDELVAFHERFGPSTDAARALRLRGSDLLRVPDAFSVQQKMIDIQAKVPSLGWYPRWLPVFGDVPDIRCLDLEGALDGTKGQVLTWHEEGAHDVEAPSFAGWVGTLVLAIDAGVLVWDGEGIDLAQPGGYDELREIVRHVLPGFPRRVEGER